MLLKFPSQQEKMELNLTKGRECFLFLFYIVYAVGLVNEDVPFNFLNFVQYYQKYLMEKAFNSRIRIFSVSVCIYVVATTNIVNSKSAEEMYKIFS